MKHDNLKIIGTVRQMRIPLNNGARRAVLEGSSLVSGSSNLKIWDNRLHAHTVA